MKLLRFVLRAMLVLPWILFGLFCVSLVYRLLNAGQRAALNRFWSRWLMRLCGVRLSIKGEPRMTGAVLWVANHVSWIDIFVVNAVRATSFVAKSEIRSWPVIGWLAAGAGTLFIERTQRHAVHAMGESIHDCFARGEAVGLFPEGTTSEGFELRPFHASLFEPARSAKVDVQPLVLRFMHRGKRSGFAAFVGEETLLANLWRVLGTTGLTVEVVFLPPLPTFREDGSPCTRLELARQAREAILAQL
ncbi:lysophospholipid acyltransferase family protein [Bordetella avium]|uniref:Phospholipid/glycerol acyltransferase n=1 Tax=Bordetella avium (strain 197N) TaxID=360910 RepID=Q2KUT8_BORA1|nr:lysophospholipid acyltransferase family protein [Bordetella avium]AZY50354.1 1-acyl-sn-glycerol-3-phosphate acyltransferase [Bordetella avium]AZY53747.1 1-acyl-sn-glycerol-3-phosphate acyltransferase [Bordetella avium]RIQ15478.1 1-acyl-sn-glycerol-3-phosphate acyltransferase [Bordetella avium]RIQ19715.1 1-acyl-sn-glycerol-3-phosphate acyltransferase [Bordetella avium]RIQ34295.1 1-acyl-sn-glycerol-3-phosphate acyltransferase [Bordetella avium]